MMRAGPHDFVQVPIQQGRNHGLVTDRALDLLGETERTQVDALVQLFRHVHGDAAVGGYLFGSAVTSGLRPDSDLDFLVISSRRTSGSERRALIDGLLPISRSRGDPTDRRHVEVTVVARPAIQPWHYPPPMELQYGDWWRREFEAGEEPWASPNPDLAVLLTAARAEGVPLFGPPIAEFVDPIPRDDLGRAMHDVIPGLIENLDDDVRNVLLTLARVLFTLETGAIAAKDVAADWVIARLPDDRGEALRQARAAYLGDEDDSWDAAAMAAARADAAAILAAIETTRTPS
jgi:streptomycin 3"-adenylyltransferase